MDKILVTKTEYEKARDFFNGVSDFQCLPAPADEASLSQAIRNEGAKYVIVGVEKYSGGLYEALPKGGVIARFGVGHDGIDKATASAKGIFCTNTPGTLDDAVAECAIALMLDAARHIANCANAVRNGQWDTWKGIQLGGRTLAIIGGGHIGRKVAKIASAGLGMKVLCYDVASVDCPFFDECYTDFAEAVRQADVVSLHLPVLPSTLGFLNQERLSSMKTGAILVNTARGAVVDEEALYDALANGKLSCAALDVFQNEPYKPVTPGKDLRTLPNVLMTAHIASSTQEACLAMAAAAVENIRSIHNGAPQKASLLNKIQ